MSEDILRLSSKAQKEDQIPYSVADFRKLAENSVPYFNFQVPFKKIEEDYIIYRNKEWQSSPLLKTYICLPGTAYINLNTVNLDVAFPGLLSFLPSDHQIIIPIFPNAPENKFPTPFVHLQRTLANLIEKSKQYLIDMEKVILGGYSCGGTLTVPLAIHFAKRNFYFRSLAYISPIFDYSGELGKREQLKKWQYFQKKDNKTLSSKFIEFINNQYSRSGKDLYDPRYSPIFTPIEDLSLLKNNCFIYGEFDFMRRTIQAFKERLTLSGVGHETTLLEGEGHRCMIMMRNKNTIESPEMEQSAKLKKIDGLRQIANCLKRLLK